jgi:predicted enzyme related to lactoylglutathione lyase
MPTRETAPVGAPCWIDLMTSDPAGSQAFYGRLFGWTVMDPGPEYGGYVNFLRDGVPVAGCMGAMAVDEHVDADGGGGQQAGPDAWSVYLASDDIQKTADAAVAAGGHVLVPPMAVMELGSMAVVVDAGGATIGIWQPGLHQGFGVLAEPNAPYWFELHTRDYDASVAFYRDAFRWDAHVAADEPGFRYTTLGEGDGQLAGIMDATAFLPDGVPAHWSVYFGTLDADATLARIVELGGSVVQPAEDTPYGRLATAADPTGAVFKLIQP